jgi:hypothetical protein
MTINALLIEAADALQAYVDQLVESHTVPGTGTLDSAEVTMQVESERDLVNRLREAALVVADAVQEPVAYITPLMEQQMFDDWCPYKGSPDPRTVWAAAVEAVNGLLLGAIPPTAQRQWVGLTTADLDEIDAPIRERGSATIAEIYRAIEAKLREKNAAPAAQPAPCNPAQDGVCEALGCGCEAQPAVPLTELVDYILQDDIANRLTPRVVDIAYSAFLLAKHGQNKDDGGPCDWFNDTKPMVIEALAKIRKDLAEAAHGITAPAQKGGEA